MTLEELRGHEALRTVDRRWVDSAVSALLSDGTRSADTHLMRLDMPEQWGVDIYLKDESSHPSGSLKHRLARSLFLYGLVNGDIVEGTTIVEASSGSTAVSEAYFARLLGLPFVAVVPEQTSPAKVAEIERHGGRIHLVADPGQIYAESARLAQKFGGHFMDQFTNASLVTDWRGNNNIGESIFDQMTAERHPIPSWVVLGAGTGGTSATIGRYCRYKRVGTGVALVDPEGSAFFEAVRTGRRDVVARGSKIEGIGRPRVEPSFMPTVIDRAFVVRDNASIGALREFRDWSGIAVGGSTGTNLVGTFALAAEMIRCDRPGSIVTLMCDRGERYLDSYYSDSWVQDRGLDLAPCQESVRRFLATGELSDTDIQRLIVNSAISKDRRPQAT